MTTAADSIARLSPETIVVITPHAPISPGRVFVSGHGALKGDLGRFGARGASVDFEGDGELARRIHEEADSEGIGVLTDSAGDGRKESAIVTGGRGGLDHGVVVPLYFVCESIRKFAVAQPKLVVISIAYLSNVRLYNFGGCIARAATKSGRRTALIASGDLSHKLTSDGPYGYDPSGPRFDKYIVDCVAKRDVRTLLGTDGDFLESAAQCGFYGLVMLFGAIDEIGGPSPRILSYEGTFGVGYVIAHLL
jgi:aromatic ring-opening dioxygenase LigB subunit